jgi:GT2 family glycosyltransferase
MPGEIDLSVLFITYNRSDLLEICLRSLQERADFADLRVEFMVSDNASDPPHLERIKQLPFDKFAFSPVNRGLANNCNKGLAQASGAFFLQIQDDCEFCGDPALVLIALRILREDPSVGSVQLTHQTRGAPHEFRRLADGTTYRVFHNDGQPGRRPSGARPYSDQPHLKRREFFADIGPYLEDVSMVDTELDYQERVACQHRWQIASIELAPGFRHLGGDRSFNPAALRARRIQRMESIAVIGPVLRHGRQVARRVRQAWRGASR